MGGNLCLIFGNEGCAKEPAYTNQVTSVPTTAKSKRRRKIAVSSAIVVAIAVYLWIFGFQTATAISARWMLRKMPVAYMTPAALKDTALSEPAGCQLEYFGYKFEVPWDDLDAPAVRVGKTRAVIPFRSGLVLSVYSGSNHEFVDELTTEFHVTPQQLIALRKSQEFRSDYDFHRAMLGIKPSSITPFSSQKFAAAAMTLLIIKAIAVPEDSGIFDIKREPFRGFQYGDPTKHPRRIVVDLYSGDRSAEVVFLRKDNQPLDLSQADINRVIQTLSYSSSPLGKS